MPLTASHAAATEGNTAFKTRVLAAMEGLILAGVLYLVSSVRTQELSMAKIEASTQASQQAMAALPALTIRVVEVEKDNAEQARQIQENKEDLKELRARARLQ